MANINRLTSKRAIGIVHILGSLLIALGSSTLGNPPSANAVTAYLHQSQVNSQLDTYLTHTPGGEAQLLWDGDSTLTVTIDMSGGVAPLDIHPASINKGSCETDDNGVLYPLSPVQPKQPSPSNSTTTPVASDAPTIVNISSTTIIPVVQTGIPSSGWFLSVYNGPTLSTPTQSIPIACADITNFNTSTKASQYVSLALGPTKGPNQAANGIATTTLYNNQLVIAIKMSGLAPNSTHLADIHQGSCNSQGPMVRRLTPVVANASGIGNSRTILSGMASIPNNWYVNVHLGATETDMSTQAGFDPFVCGNIGTRPPSSRVVSQLASQLNSQSNTYLTHSPTGSAQLLWDKTSTLTVSIDMTGELVPSRSYSASINKGSCETDNNGVLYPLSPVRAQVQRSRAPNSPKTVNMASNTIIPLVRAGLPSNGWFLSVYNGPDRSLPIACADITNLNTSTQASQYVSLVLGPTKGPNQAANGTATTTLYNNEFVVTITMSGLMPNSTHQADISQGRCSSQGSMAQRLTPVVADASGIGTSTTAISGITAVPNNWYVNVHLGATKSDPKTQADFDPFVCGDININ